MRQNQTHKTCVCKHVNIQKARAHPSIIQCKHKRGARRTDCIFSFSSMLMKFKTCSTFPKQWQIFFIMCVWYIINCTVQCFPYYVWQSYSHASLQIWAGCHTDLLQGLKFSRLQYYHHWTIGNDNINHVQDLQFGFCSSTSLLLTMQHRASLAFLSKGTNQLAVK